MQEPLNSLKETVNAIQPFSDAEWIVFSGFWKTYEAKRKEVLTFPGQRERYLYFVAKGVQRVYYFDDQQREATLVFTYPPSFGGVLDAMMLGSPSRYYYEALTPSVFLRAPYAEIEKLITEMPAVEGLIRKGIVQSLSGLLERLVELQCMSAEERFKKLLSRSPHILQLVPHKYLANYLGMDPTNFSKLINKIRI